MNKLKLATLLVTLTASLFILTGCSDKLEDTVGVYVDGDLLTLGKGKARLTPSMYTGRDMMEIISVSGKFFQVDYTYSDNFILSKNNPNKISPELAQKAGKLNYIGYNFGDNVTVFKEEGLDVGIFEAAFKYELDSKGVSTDSIASRIYSTYKNNILFKPKEVIKYLDLNGIAKLDIEGQAINYEKGILTLPDKNVSILRISKMDALKDVTDDKIFGKDVLMSTWNGDPIIIFNSELAIVGLTKADLEAMKGEK